MTKNPALEEWFKSYIGETINYFTIQELIRKNCRWFFVCKCKCGNIVQINARNVVEGKHKSCGCFLKSKEYREATSKIRKKYLEEHPEAIQHLSEVQSKNIREQLANDPSRLDAFKQGYLDKHDNSKLCQNNPKLYTTIRTHWRACYIETTSGFRLYGAKGWKFADEWLNEDNEPLYDKIIEWCLNNGWDDKYVFEKDYLANELRLKEIGPKTVRFVPLRENIGVHYIE